MPNFYSICLFSLFGCPCVFVVSGLETTFLEYLPSFRLYLPGYVFTCQTPPIPHPVKCARFVRPSECEKVLVCLLNIFCQTIGCSFIPLKMTILLVIWANNLQFTISQWQVLIQTLCFSFLFWYFHFFYLPSVSCGVFNLPCLRETRKGNPLLFFPMTLKFSLS